MLRLITAIIIAISAIASYAQANYDALQVLDDAIAVPVISQKADTDLRRHILDIKEALEKYESRVVTDCDGRVVKVTIPASRLFKANRVELRNAAAMLDIFRQVIALPTMYKVVVAVSSDDTGDDEYRDYITDTRATAISDYMTNLVKGRDANIVAIGLSDLKPVANNNSIAGRMLNRRIDVYIVPEAKMLEMAKAGKLRK